jgi:hypothetical protein
MRGLHFRLGQEQQVRDAQEDSPVDHGDQECPANASPASLGPDGKRADLRLARAPHQLAALRPDLEHHSADERAAVIHGDQHRIDAVSTELAQPRRVAGIGRQEAVGQVCADSNVSDQREVVWMCVPDEHSAI